MAKNKSKNTKNNFKNTKTKDVEKKQELTGWKAKLALFILISEILVAIGMLIMIFTRETLSIFKGNKIIWVMYLVTQIILTFTMLSKKKDVTKGTFHLETMLVTITYLFIV